MKTKYPKWFNSYSPGYKPTPPPKILWQYKKIMSQKAHQYDYQELVEGSNCFSITIGTDYDNDVDITITYYYKSQVPNPNYAKDYKEHEKMLKQYQIELGEWYKWKKIWDEEQKMKQKNIRLKEYNKLKKEFD